MERTTDGTGFADFDRIFNAAPTVKLLISFTEVTHFDTKYIQWRAVEVGICKEDQWIAYRMAGFEYTNQGWLHLVFECKAFNDDAGINQDEKDSEPLRAYLPLNWHSCDAYAN